MRSMTGFGRAAVEKDGNRVAVELAAVNSKKRSDIRTAIPRELSGLDPVIKRRIGQVIRRGSITVSVTYGLNPEAQCETLQIETQLAKHLINRLKALAQETGISDDITLRDLIALPGIISAGITSPTEHLREIALQALDQALEALLSMQQDEGGALKQDLQERLRRLVQITKEIAAQSDTVLTFYCTRLRERMALLGVDATVNQECIAKEAALYAERSDITEEVVRLRSHLQQFSDKLEADEEVGRALEFITQEMSREISTVCAKTPGQETAGLGLKFKIELGKIREQIMNVG